MKRRRGFTLIEVMIASFVGLLVVAAAITLNLAAKNGVDRDETSFQLEEELVEAVNFLQHDFRYTTLASVRLYPRDDNETQGASMIAAEPLGQFGKVQLSQFGTPNWQKYVYYTLQSQQAGSARLVRYEAAASSTAFQLVSDHLPSAYQEIGNGHIVCKNILDKGWGMTGKRDSLVTLDEDENAPGGFDVHFLQSDGKSTYLNPSEDDPAKGTGIIEIGLSLLDTSDLDKVSMLPFRFRVYPRN